MNIRKNVNEFQAKPFGRGQAFKCVNRDGRVYSYLISCAAAGRVFLANLETGKSWNKDVVAADPTCLSPAEAAALFDGLEIIAALEVSTKEIEVTKPGRTLKVGQSFLFRHPYKEGEVIYQIVCAGGNGLGRMARLICQAGDRLGWYWNKPVSVDSYEVITQAEFDEMSRDLIFIEEVKPTFEAA